jgi:antitoxin (DNA-binding transcriptional repressor) of toxin-antitoxin stability system
METRVTSNEATAQFAELLKRVRDEGETVVIEEGGRAVCTMQPVKCNREATLAEIVASLQSGPTPDNGYAKDVEDFVAAMNRPALPESPWDR